MDFEGLQGRQCTHQDWVWPLLKMITVSASQSPVIFSTSTVTFLTPKLDLATLCNEPLLVPYASRNVDLDPQSPTDSTSASSGHMASY